MDREKELLNEVSRLAGRINKHKQHIEVRKERLLDEVSRLSAKIDERKSQLVASPEINSQKKSLKRSREDLARDSLRTKPQPSSSNGLPVARYSKLSKPALKKFKANQIRAPKIEKKEELCRYYTQFGKCNKYSKCVFRHDPEKVAPCPLFLRGECHDEKCLLRHKLDHLSNRMPVCVHFLKGTCSHLNCPYLHVKVDDNAEVCPEFLKGFCPRGPTCSMRHEKPLKISKEDLDENARKMSSHEERKEPLSQTFSREVATKIIPKFALNK